MLARGCSVVPRAGAFAPVPPRAGVALIVPATAGAAAAVATAALPGRPAPAAARGADRIPSGFRECSADSTALGPRRRRGTACDRTGISRPRGSQRLKARGRRPSIAGGARPPAQSKAEASKAKLSEAKQRQASPEGARGFSRAPEGPLGKA